MAYSFNSERVQKKKRAFSARSLLATRAYQLTKAVQQSRSRPVDSQQTVPQGTSSGPHYISRLSSTVYLFRQERLSRNMTVPAVCVPGLRPFRQYWKPHKRNQR